MSHTLKQKDTSSGQEIANDTSYEYNTCQGLALISIITDDCFDFEHVSVLFCNDSGGKML